MEPSGNLPPFAGPSRVSIQNRKLPSSGYGYAEEGLTRDLAAARVCQDIVLKAIAKGSLNRKVTIKGGVVMRSLTQNNRRATQTKDYPDISGISAIR